MERMEFRSGAAETELLELGNAGAAELRVEGAVGDVTLDFTGRWSRDMEASIRKSVGLASLI